MSATSWRSEKRLARSRFLVASTLWSEREWRTHATTFRHRAAMPRDVGWAATAARAIIPARDRFDVYR
jgi:hypothetical protein